MSRIFELEKKARNLGWFSGNKILIEIVYESEFEGYYGRASESWEQRVTVKTHEIKNDTGKVIWPETVTVGKRWETIDDVMERAADVVETFLVEEGEHA